MDLDHRHFVDSQHGIVVEITLLHAALVDGDGAIKHSAETVDDAALHLRYHLIRVYVHSAVDGANHPVDTYFAVFRD